MELCIQLLFTDQILMLVQKHGKYSTKSPDNNQWFIYNCPLDPRFFKDLVWNCQTPAILWFSRIDRDPRLLSPMHVVPLKKQKNMPDPMGEGLARDEAMNHGQ